MALYSSAFPPARSGKRRSGTILTPREQVTYASACGACGSDDVVEDPTSAECVVTPARTSTSYVMVNSASSVPEAIKISAETMVNQVQMQESLPYNTSGG